MIAPTAPPEAPSSPPALDAPEQTLVQEMLGTAMLLGLAFGVTAGVAGLAHAVLAALHHAV